MKKATSNNLEIQNFHASVEGKEILKGVTLTVKPGEVHAIMGPNGSGKSTFAFALMGHPLYKLKIQNSKLKIGNRDITDLPTKELAREGLYLAMQSPIAIPGVSVMQLLRTAYQQIHGSGDFRDQSFSYSGNLPSNKPASIQNPVLARRWQANGMGLPEFTSLVKEYAHALRLDESFLERSIHDGFSGGEKKKLEMLQASVLKPTFAVFDEIDTGLDVDALRVVARGIKRLAKEGTGIIVITHYQRILKYVKPDVVHVFVDGKIVDSGRARLAKKIEENGYSAYAH